MEAKSSYSTACEEWCNGVHWQQRGFTVDLVHPGPQDSGCQPTPGYILSIWVISVYFIASAQKRKKQKWKHLTYSILQMKKLRS